LKNSIVLLELLVSLLLFSFLAISSSKMLLTLVEKNQQSTQTLEQNLLLETTRLFIQKHNDFSLYTKVNDSLYFQGNLLLDNISLYELTTNSTVNIIVICLEKYNDEVCQTWKIKV
jgi:type II secretory pathway component PulJ